MTAKEYLQSVRRADMNINYRRNELYKLKQDALRVSPQQDGERVQSSGNADTMRIIDRIVDMQNEINKEIDSYIALKNEARNLISLLPNERHRTVLTEYYLNHKTWADVAESLQIDERWVYRLHGRALKNFEKNTN